MSTIIRQFIFAIIVMIGLSMSSVAFAQSNDAIAMRIMPNPQHYSALRWYQENVDKDQQGSPTQLFVDGYGAVRDGRTVYVNAANVSSNGTLYTNIYIISYTQSASGETQDIFGQLLNNWTFNTDLIADPGSGVCFNIQTNQETSTGGRCYTDAQCGAPGEQYCKSAKAEVTRDVRRLADIRDIERAIGLRHNTTQSFPTLTAGTYVPRRTLSVWPSWQATLGRELGVTLPVDPLNSLWSCRDKADKDPAGDGTCWNETDRIFNKGATTAIPDGIVPGFGYAYAYVNDSDANSPLYPRLCAAMETSYEAVNSWRCSNTSGARVDISNIRIIY